MDILLYIVLFCIAIPFIWVFTWYLILAIYVVLVALKAVIKNSTGRD